MTKLLAALLIAVSLPAAAELNCQEKSALAMFAAVPYDSAAYNGETAIQRMQRKEAYQRLANRDVLENGGAFVFQILPILSQGRNANVNSAEFAAAVLKACKRGAI